MPLFSKQQEFFTSVPPRFDGDGEIDGDFNHIPNNPQVIMNETVRMYCPANAIPPPQITWFKNGVEIDFDRNEGDRVKILNDGKMLEIQLSEIGDTARYTCIARNLAGESEKNFDLDVQG